MNRPLRSRVTVAGTDVRGFLLDGETRCTHYHSDRDIVAIRFKCCDVWYPCYRCHDALAAHAGTRWTRCERDVEAILCGHCGGKLTIQAYLDCGARCPNCGAAFNAACVQHHARYFEM